MYESFFQLTGRPFAAAPNRHQYFAAGAIEHARRTLARCIARGEGPALLVGPPGTGKSLLCQLLADDFDGQLDCVPLASGNLGTSRSMLQVMLHALDLPYRGLDEGELRLALADRAVRQRNVHGILLLVDEAQVLPARLLEELRLMTNLVRDGQSQIRLVLSGSAELEERFASPKLESFSQRLAARCYLEAYQRDETRNYVTARITACGAEVDRVFTDAALEQIHLATEGIPRLINQLADHALVLGFAAGRRSLDGDVIKEAWADLQQLPTPWNHSNQSNHAAVASDTAGGPDTIEFGALDDEPVAEPVADPVESSQWDVGDDEPATVPWPHFAGSVVTEPVVPAAEADVTHGQLPFRFPATPAEVAEDFAEEEVVVDLYAALDAQQALIRHRVSSVEGRELWSQLAPHAEIAARQCVRLVTAAEIEPPVDHSQVVAKSTSPPAATPAARYGERTVEEYRPATPATPAAATPADLASSIDDDLIVIEDDIESLELAQAPGFGRVRRQEYTQLFKKLRNG